MYGMTNTLCLNGNNNTLFSVHNCNRIALLLGIKSCADKQHILDCVYRYTSQYMWTIMVQYQNTLHYLEHAHYELFLIRILNS